MGIDPRRFGPTRGELWFRFWAAVAILALMLVAFAVQGLPSGPAMVEIGLIAGGFGLGTAVWAARRLILRLHP